MPGSVKVLFPCLVLVVLLAVAPSAAYAAGAQPAPKDQGLITVSPSINKITLGSGLLEAKTYVQVSNGTNHKLTAKAELVDFKNLNESGGLTLGQVGVPLWKYGLANWMKVANGTTISLAPGESTKLEVDIENRTDLSPGGHYGAVLIKADPNKSAGQSNPVDFNQNLVSLLFVKKLGGEKYGLELSSLDTGGGYDLPQSVTTSFRSTGNVYVIPRGYIEVTDPKGKVVEKGIINQDSRIVMQGTTQKLITLMRPVEDSSAGGRYKLTAYYRYEGQKDYATKTVYFNRGLDKIKILAITTLILTGVAAILVRRRMSRQSKKSSKYTAK